MFALNRRLALVAVASFASLSSIACTSVTEEDANAGPSEKTEQSESEIRTTLGKKKKIPQACPPVAMPMCASGTELVAEKDSVGCTFYSCKTVCPEIDVPACAATDELVTGADENGCSFAYCKPAASPASE